MGIFIIAPRAALCLPWAIIFRPSGASGLARQARNGLNGPRSAIRPAGRVLLRLGFDVGHLIFLSRLVVGNPFANLLSILEVPRPHLRAVLSEPLPISSGQALGHHPLGPNTPVFVILGVLLQ